MSAPLVQKVSFVLSAPCVWKAIQVLFVFFIALHSDLILLCIQLIWFMCHFSQIAFFFICLASPPECIRTCNFIAFKVLSFLCLWISKICFLEYSISVESVWCICSVCICYVLSWVSLVYLLCPQLSQSGIFAVSSVESVWYICCVLSWVSLVYLLCPQLSQSGIFAVASLALFLLQPCTGIGLTCMESLWFLLPVWLVTWRVLFLIMLVRCHSCSCMSCVCCTCMRRWRDWLVVL